MARRARTSSIPAVTKKGKAPCMAWARFRMSSAVIALHSGLSRSLTWKGRAQSGSARARALKLGLVAAPDQDQLELSLPKEGHCIALAFVIFLFAYVLPETSSLEIVHCIASGSNSGSLLEHRILFHPPSTPRCSHSTVNLSARIALAEI